MKQHHNEALFRKSSPLFKVYLGQLVVLLVSFIVLCCGMAHHHQQTLVVVAETSPASSSLHSTLQPIQTIQPHIQSYLKQLFRPDSTKNVQSTDGSTTSNNVASCLHKQQQEHNERLFQPSSALSSPLVTSDTLSELLSSSNTKLVIMNQQQQHQPHNQYITTPCERSQQQQQHLELSLQNGSPLSLRSTLENTDTSTISPSNSVFYNTTYYFGYFSITYSLSGGSPVYFGTVAKNQLSNLKGPNSPTFQQISSQSTFSNSELRLSVGGQASYFVWYNSHSSQNALLQLSTFSFIYKTYTSTYSVSMTRGDVEMFYCYSCISVPNTRYIISLRSLSGTSQNVSVGYTYDKSLMPSTFINAVFSSSKVFYIDPLVPYPAGSPPPVYAYVACLGSNGCSGLEITLRMSDDLQDLIIIVIASVLGSLVLCTCLILVVSVLVCRYRRQPKPSSNASSSNALPPGVSYNIPLNDHVMKGQPQQTQQPPIMVSSLPKQPPPSSLPTTTTTTTTLPYYTNLHPYHTMPNPPPPTTTTAYYVPTNQSPHNIYNTLPTSIPPTQQQHQQYRTPSFVNPQHQQQPQPPMMMVGMPPTSSTQPIMYQQQPHQQPPTLTNHSTTTTTGGSIGAPLPSSSSSSPPHVHVHSNNSNSINNTAFSQTSTLNNTATADTATTTSTTTSSSIFIETYRESSDAASSVPHKNQSSRTSNAQDSEDDRSLLKGRYKVIEKVGKGTFGDCYLCHDIKRNNQAVAVKSIRVDDNDMEKVIDECSKTLTFKHPRLVEVYELFKAKSLESLCLVMKFYQSDLEKCFKTHGFFSEKVIVELIHQIGDGLDYLHNTKMVLHRDLKPKNIFVDKYDEKAQTIDVVIGDYGEAKEMGDTTNSVRGTIIYMSPECLTGQKYSFPSDIFSMGVSFFQLMTGETFNNIGVASRMLGETEEQVMNSLREQLSKNQLYHEPLINFILSMLRKDPQKRPTAIDMKNFHE